MHREFDPRDTALGYKPPLGLYALSLAVLVLLLLDIAPYLVQALAWMGVDVSWPISRDFYGIRYALIAAVVGCVRVLVGALDRLTEGHIGADLAVGVACIAAILLGEPLIAAEVIVISLIGECLEAITFGRAQKALGQLHELFPIRCWVLRGGVEERVLTTELVVGDRVVVKPGGKIPADGRVVEGQAAVNVAALTGESLPLEKGPGSAVLAGSIVPSGSLILEVERVSTQTIAGQVVALTEKALAEKSQGERLADRVAKVFLPIVLGLAFFVFIVNVLWQRSAPVGLGVEQKTLTWGEAARVAAYPTLGVLVVACPCPLILATPAAVMAALARLAGTGVVLKSGAALERLAQIQSIAFDKTGTLTEGKLELGSLRPALGRDPEELLRVAASLEAKSEHPIARAILAHVPEPELAREFRAIPGLGVVGVSATGEMIAVGSRKLFIQEGITLPSEAEAAFTELEALGESAVAVVRSGEWLGVLGVRDRLRPEAVGVVDELQAMGLSPIAMLTGDRRIVATAIAGNLPGLELYADLLPADKAEWIAKQAKPTAFIGDGINDAPALARASVGLAVGSGTDVAVEVGDIVFMGEPLRPLPMLIRLSRKTTQVIRQNILGFGFGMNLFGVLLTGLLWPLFATSPAWFEKAPLVGVVYHQLGSLLVLVNSLRLLRFERTPTAATRGFTEATRGLDRFFTRWTADEVLHELGHHWKWVLGSVIGLSLIVWFASGVTQINPAEVGVVQRFGNVRDDLAPGLHVRWPYPIETVTKVRPQEIKLVEIGFRVLSDERRKALESAKAEQQRLRRPGGNLAVDTSLTWASSHAEGIDRKTDEFLIVTGDGNLVELFATVRYRIISPREYLFTAQNPESVIRNAAEGIFRELTAGQAFAELLTNQRARLESEANRRLPARVSELAPAGLGIELQGLTIHDLHPQQEVVNAYQEVAMAIQRRDKTINDALAEAQRLRQRAQEDSLRITRQAEAAKTTRIEDATASRDAFLAWAKARNTVPEPIEKAWLADFEARAQAGQDRTALGLELAQKRERYLRDRRQLTDFRLTLDAVTLVLQGRDKIFLDATQLPGRRHILLMEPDPKLPSLMAPLNPPKDQ
ncbi:MAG: cation-translocating P-type ATPase family protein [Fimbriiglobus sp.]